MIKTKNVELFQEDDEYYLKIVAEEVCDGVTHEVVIPKAHLPIANLNIVENIPLGHLSFFEERPEFWISLENNKLHMVITDVETTDVFGRPSKYECAYYKRLIKEDPVEMTMSEIEKKLGHPFKIVKEV